MYNILYGAMPDYNIMSIEQEKLVEKTNKKREKMSEEAKRIYKLSQEHNNV